VSNIRKIVLGLTLFMLFGCEGGKVHILDGPTMGTSYTVKIVGPIDKGKLKLLIENELVRINSLMSTYDDQSELSRFNRSPISTSVPVSEDVLTVLRMSQKIHDESNGAFDVTIGPLVNLWGFGPGLKENRIPEFNQIEETKSRIGFDNLSMTAGGLVKSKEIYVDLSAIAKGFAVDQIASILDREMVSDYLVEVGGELRAKGVNSRGIKWSVGIEKPDISSRSVYQVLQLEDSGMATSGDYRNFFEVDGVRYSHTIDPRTGMPVTHNVASVTVIAKSTAMADGYATAINVLGAEEGMKLAENQNLAVLVIIEGQDGFTSLSSSAMAAHLKTNEKPEAK
jgi:FAD:protein FMN transferase